MKFDEFIEELQDNGILIARCASGRYFCGEIAYFVRFNEQSVVVRSKSGKNIRINDVNGNTAVAGKHYRDCFVSPVSRMDSELFFPCTI